MVFIFSFQTPPKTDFYLHVIVVFSDFYISELCDQQIEKFCIHCVKQKLTNIFGFLFLV